MVTAYDFESSRPGSSSEWGASILKSFDHCIGLIRAFILPGILGTRAAYDFESGRPGSSPEWGASILKGFDHCIGLNRAFILPG